MKMTKLIKRLEILEHERIIHEQQFATEKNERNRRDIEIYHAMIVNEEKNIRDRIKKAGN